MLHESGMKLSIMCAVLLAGCGGTGGTDGGWEAVRDTVGDTVVVRTVSGSVWGGAARLVEELRIGRLEGPEESTFGRIVGLAVAPDGTIYVADQQVPALRKYAPDGSYLGLVGGAGEGPGEYSRPDGGLAVLPDGRIALRDPGNARIQLFGPDGEPAGTWPVRGSSFTSRPLYVDTTGHVYHMVFDFGQEETRVRLAVFDPETGSEGAVDTLDVPEWDVETPTLEAVHVSEEGGTSRSRRSVPFSPRDVWTFHPRGWFVGGVTDRYAVYLFRDDGPVLRIEREREPVPVRPGERDNVRERTVAAMRTTDPDWRWDGPEIPGTKPPWRSVFAGREGRIWVQLHTPAEPIPEDEIGADEDLPGERPPERWREPLVFDVFEPDGRYLGRVEAPEGMDLSPGPVIRGDRVWAVARDALGVDYVVRYRLELPSAAQGAGT